MKIGILTILYRKNYGGMLQCIALQNVLINYGHNVEVIRYRPKKKNKGLIKQLLFSTPRECINKLKSIIANFRPRHLCDFGDFYKNNQSFIKENINYTEECDEDSIGKLIEKHNYDIIVIGSDKVWGGISQKQLTYFGEWYPNFKGQIISYAACSSRTMVPLFNRKKITLLFNKFKAISVRDEHTKLLFSPFTFHDIKIVSDPTLLYSFSIPDHICQDNEPYILTYILGDTIKGGHGQLLKDLKEIIKVKRIKAVVIPNTSLDVTIYADEIINFATPFEWLSLIKNAAFVYTDSYHGLLFSLRLRKQYLGYYSETARSTRLLDLKRTYDAPNIVSSYLDFKQNYHQISDNDFERINQLFSNTVEMSKMFLEKNLFQHESCE